MRVNCYFTHQSCNSQDFAGGAAIVIDVLRATSTMITALLAGAKAIIPIAEIAHALAAKEQMPAALLAGEREGERLEGFDMGNSPLEFTAPICAGRIIIACTTNGTSAMHKARSADKMWLGALLNAKAVALQAAAQANGKLSILCSGTDGCPSLDDTVTAGAILYHLRNTAGQNGLDLNDAAAMALALYESYAHMDMFEVLALSKHGQKLIRFGWEHDVRFCARENTAPVVPWLDKDSGHIILP